MPADSLDHITIKGFKSIASIEKLELRPINILIGANGSGKSNFIGAFAFLHQIREGRLQRYVTASGGAEKLLHFGSKTTKEVRFELSFKAEIVRYELSLSATGDDSLFPAEETASYWDKDDPRQHKTLSPMGRRLEAGISNPELTRTEGIIRKRIGDWRLYHVHDTSSTSPMRKTAKVDNNKFLEPEGGNLASFLFGVAPFRETNS